MDMPTYVGVGALASGTGDVTPAIPAAGEEDDLLLLFIESANDTGTDVTPAGWAEAPDSPQAIGTSGDAAATRLEVYYKHYNGVESGPPVADRGDHTVAQVMAFRGCMLDSNPFNKTAGNTSAASTSITIPGDTTNVTDCLVVAAVAHNLDASGAQVTGFTNASLASFAEEADGSATAGNGGGLAIAVGEKATAGAVSATTATIASAVQARWMGALLPYAPQFDQLIDPFESLDRDKWTLSGDTYYTAERVALPVRSDYNAGFTASRVYSLYDSYCNVHFDPPAVGNGAREFQWELSQDPDNLIMVYKSGSGMATRVLEGGVETTEDFPEIEARWWRIVHASTTDMIYIDISHNGIDWDELDSRAAPGFDLNYLTLTVGAGFYGGAEAPSILYIDSINVIPERTDVEPTRYIAAGFELPSDRLSIVITHQDGSTSRWGGDEESYENIPLGLSFSTSMPGGFKDLNCSLSRRIDIAYDDLTLFDDVDVIGPGGQKVWEGRTTQFPRSHGESTSISVGCVGHAAALRDNPNFSQVYVDRDLSHWEAISRQREFDLVTANYKPLGSEVAPDKSTGLPSLNLKLSDSWISPYKPIVESWYDAGVGLNIESIYYDYVLSASGGAWIFSIYSADADTAAGATAALTAGGVASGNGTATTAAKRWALMQYFYNATPAGSQGAEYLATVRYLTVFGNHGVAKSGTAPHQGYLASDIIPHILGQVAPSLNFTPGESIERSDFVIPQLEFRQPTTGEDAIMKINGYHLWEFGCYDNKTFFFRKPTPDRLIWDARLSDGCSLDLEGESAEDCINGVIVRFTDVEGKAKSVGPVGSQCDETSLTLMDPDTANPATTHGYKRWAVLDLSVTTTPAGAIQIGTAFLAEKLQPNRTGSITLRGYVRHPDGGFWPVWYVRAGDFIRVADHSYDVPRRITETSYTHDSRTLTATLSNQVDKLSGIVERITFLTGQITG